MILGLDSMKIISSIKILFSAWRLVVKRSLAHWRLLSSVLIGVVLASTLMSGTSIYFDSLSEISLRDRLSTHDDSDLDLLIETEWGPSVLEEYVRISTIIRAEIDSRIGSIILDRIHGGRTPTFFLGTSVADQEIGENYKRTYFVFMDGMHDEIEILPGGTFPPIQDFNSMSQSPQINVLVSADSAEKFNVSVGDILVAAPTWDDTVSRINVIVSGIFKTKEPVNRWFWDLEEKKLTTATGDLFETIPFYVTQESYFAVLGNTFLDMESIYAWSLDIDHDSVNAWNANSVAQNVDLVNRYLSSSLPNYNQQTVLDRELRDYDQRLFFTKLPMLVVLFLISIVILYYVATLSSLSVENRRSEVALLHSRGANSLQLLTVFVLEATTISLLAIVLAPILAGLVIGSLGYSPMFSNFTSGSGLEVRITLNSYLLSGLGGILSFISMIIPAFHASRLGVTLHRRLSARPKSLPAFQRYYLDVMLLLISVVLFYQLTDQGSVVATSLLGEPAANQLLLAMPGIALVSIAMIMLRLFPFLMSQASNLLSSMMPVGPVMALWQMAREPSHYARLALLLILTSGLGIFASSFAATLNKNSEQRVLHYTGGDFRLLSVLKEYSGAVAEFGSTGRSPVSGSIIAESYSQISGVKNVTPILRTQARDLTLSSAGGFKMVGVDTETLLDVGWFRSDYSGEEFSELLNKLEMEFLPEGIDLPSNAETLSLRVRSDRLQPTVKVRARVRNEDKLYANYTLGFLDSTGWLTLEKSLDDPDDMMGGYDSILPSFFDTSLTLVSIHIEEVGLGKKLQSGSLLIDDISVKNNSGDIVVIESFDTLTGWNVLKNTRDAFSDSLRLSSEIFDNENSSVIFSWSNANSFTSRGIFSGSNTSHLPVIASKSFLSSLGHKLGDKFDISLEDQFISVEITGDFYLFPTMSGPDELLLIADLDALNLYGNLGASESQFLPTEAWIATDSVDIDSQMISSEIQNLPGFSVGSVIDRNERLQASKIDPLVSAGWSALLVIAFSAVLVLSCIGFLVHAYISFKNRQLQFALLRTGGFSIKQLVVTVWLEQVFIITLGMIIGTWMGLRLGAIIMPFLGHDDFGSQVVPPFVMEVNWSGLLITYSGMIIVFWLITFGIIWFVSRISLQRILRLGDT